MINYFFITLIIINSLIIYFFSSYSKFINIIDKPDNIRKFHTKNTIILGGIIFYFNLIIYFFYIFFLSNIPEAFFLSKKFFFTFFICLSLIFLIGIVDDKHNLSPNKKFFLLTFVILFLVFQDFRIENINVSFYKSISLGNYSIFFTIFCFIVFMNAFNMLDGINLQCGLYFLFILFFLFLRGLPIELFFLLIISNCTYLYLNFKNKVFLGDSGTLLISFVTSYFMIQSFNNGKIIYSDEILIILLIPGLEMIRLTFERVKRKVNFLHADREHMHHIFLRKFNTNSAIIIGQIILVFPYFFSLIINNNLISILFSVFLYFFVIYFFRRRIA
jgi:UDP-GlcNAc:undecaprenyl-phosphate GlcNAc-1-phosphate transferase